MKNTKKESIKKINLTIDGIQVSVDEGTTILLFLETFVLISLFQKRQD